MGDLAISWVFIVGWVHEVRAVPFFVGGIGFVGVGFPCSFFVQGLP